MNRSLKLFSLVNKLTIVNTKNVRLMHQRSLYNPTWTTSSSLLMQNNNKNFIILKSNYAKKSKKDDKSNQIKKPKLELNNEELNRIINYNELINEMKQVIESLKNDYTKNLHLKLNTSTIEELLVKTSDGTYRLGELAQVAVKTNQLFVIDMINSPQYMKNVVETINKTSFNLNPQIDKTSIFLHIPKLTREHRENLTKTAKRLYDNAIVKLRDLDKKASRKVNDAKSMNADLIFYTNETIRYQYELHVKEAEKLKNAKQAELLAVEN